MAKAIEAAISANQWQKAISLLPSFSEKDSSVYCLKIAEKLKQKKHFELSEKYFIKAGEPKRALEMYLFNGRLKQAHSFAKEHFQKEEIKNMFTEYAQSFQTNQDYEMAEKIFIEIQMPEQAIKMYKGIQKWNKMLKLFSIYRPESLKNAHLLIGKKLEEDEQLGQAEKHYIEAGKWSAAVDMYEKRHCFEECVRICKNYASDRDTVERAKKWDGKISETDLIDILKKMYLTDSLIDYLCEKKKFEEAFKVAETAKHKMSDIYLSKAMFLEDDKRY